MPTYNHFDYNQNPNWGGPKNVRGGGRGRGRGAMSGPPVSVNPEVIQKVIVTKKVMFTLSYGVAQYSGNLLNFYMYCRKQTLNEWQLEPE
jgi:hypothetical protein